MEEPPSPSEDPNLPGIGDLPDCGEPKVSQAAFATAIKRISTTSKCGVAEQQVHWVHSRSCSSHTYLEDCTFNRYTVYGIGDEISYDRVGTDRYWTYKQTVLNIEYTRHNIGIRML